MLYGIDISNNQGDPDWHQVASAQVHWGTGSGGTPIVGPVDFGILKLSQGVAFRDWCFDASWAALRSFKWRALYHFVDLYLSNSPEAEAAYLIAQLPVLAAYDGVVLDYEPRIAARNTDDWLLRFVRMVRAATGFPTTMYLNQSTAASLTNPELAEYPLWLACLDPEPLPARIGPWQNVALQQYSWTGRVAGIGNGAVDVDLNRIARDVAGLRQLGKPAPVVAWHVVVPGALKATADHRSAKLAIDPHGKPVYLEHGADVVLDTSAAPVPDPVTRAPWVKCRLVAPEQMVWGYFPLTSLAQGT